MDFRESHVILAGSGCGEFSHHVGSIEVTDNLTHFWTRANFLVALEPSGHEEMHLLIHLQSEQSVEAV